MCQNKSMMRWIQYQILKYASNLKGCVGWLMLIPAKTLMKTSKTSKCWEECINKKNRLSLCPFSNFRCASIKSTFDITKGWNSRIKLLKLN